MGSPSLAARSRDIEQPYIIRASPIARVLRRPPRLMANANASPLFSAQPRLRDAAVAFALPFRAIRLLFATPRLRRLTLICAVVTALTWTLVVVSGFVLAPLLLELVWKRPADGGVLYGWILVEA